MISHILLTHKHWDHTGKANELIPILNNSSLEIIMGKEDS